MNPYETLDVPTDASADNIKKAYRSAVQKHHPDKGGTQENFIAVQRAYETLSDPAARARYDETGAMSDEPTMFERALVELQKMAIYFVEHCPDIESNDIIGLMKTDLRKQMAQQSKEKTDLTRQADKMRKASLRFKSTNKNKAENAFSKAMEARAANLDAATAICDKKIKFGEQCLEILSEYSYDFAVPERTMAAQWWSAGGVTNIQ